MTFVINGERLHFYYHEQDENDWQPGGHTSRRELRILGCDPETLRARSDVLATAFVKALGGVFRERSG